MEYTAHANGAQASASSSSSYPAAFPTRLPDGVDPEETGCVHTRALRNDRATTAGGAAAASCDAATALKRLTAGVRWGRKLRKGEYLTDDEQEEDAAPVDRNGKKRRKVSCYA